VSGWRCGLRIARRSLRRHLGRSILIATLIAVPIAGATVMSGLLRTMTGPEHDAYQQLGAADGLAEVSPFSAIPGWQPGAVPGSGDPDRVPERDAKKVDLAALLPPGSRAVHDDFGGRLRLLAGDKVVRAQISLVMVGDPLTAHRARLVSGRAPEGTGEAVVSEPLAKRLGLLDGDHLRDGARLTPDDGPAVTVTGVIVNPGSTGQEVVMAPPGSDLTRSPHYERWDDGSMLYFVDLPEGADPDALWPKLAEHGIAFTPRAAYLEPDRYPQMAVYQDDPLETAGPVALVVGFGLLEVVLLAGAAFAVGARRQVRELGLIAANGGTGKHVGRTVLAEGVTLGVLGAVGGLLLGVGVTFAAWPVWEALTGEVIDGWLFGWPELALAGAVGALSGLAAALLPAIGVARMEPVDALAQRFRSTSLGARLPILGVVLLVAGLAGVLVAGVLARQELARFREAADESDGYVQPDLNLPTMVVLVAGLVAVVGLVMSTSGVVATLARIAGRLPLSGRLALRDAGRHRHRTVPAVAAIMIVVTGSVTMAFMFSGNAAGEEKTQPDNTLTLQADLVAASGDDKEAVADANRDLAAGARAVTAELPGGKAVPVPTAHGADGQVLLDVWQTNTCVAGTIGVADPAVLELTLGHRPDAGLLADLDRGKVVALDECYLQDGEVTTVPGDENEKAPLLPGRYEPAPEHTSYFNLPAAFVSAETAREQGWTAQASTVVVRYSPSASQDDIDAAIVAAQNKGLDAWESSDIDDEVNLVNLALAGGAGLVTLLGVAVTVALSAAESRADMATLAAIGAQPRRRRTFAGAQALVLSAVGTLLGLVLGGALGFAAGPLAGESGFAVPWSNLGITVFAVPLLAVGVAMLVTRAKLPMVRRLD
jgi:putative ABC transport system permease protein